LARYRRPAEVGAGHTVSGLQVTTTDDGRQVGINLLNALTIALPPL
jgi:hypothetical protein